MVEKYNHNTYCILMRTLLLIIMLIEIQTCILRSPLHKYYLKTLASKFELHSTMFAHALYVELAEY